jgi:hypothetical protein
LLGISASICWIVWSIMSAVRRIKVSRQKAELQNKLLDKFSGAPELLEYLKTEVGQRLVDTDSMEIKSPLLRILLSIQFGVVLLVLGGAFLLLRNWIPADGALACLVIGVLSAALGSKDQPYFSHGGSNVGYRCNLVAYNNGDGIVIMTNGDNGGQLASEILNTVANEYGWHDFQSVERTQIALTEEALVRFVGTYQMAPDLNILIVLEGNQLYAQVPGSGKVPISPESERKFFLKVRDAEIEFLVDEMGVVTYLELQQNGGARQFPRIGN